MGKVKDEAPAKSTKAAIKAPTMRGARQSLGPFIANLFRAESIRRRPEIRRELTDHMDVRSCGTLGIVSALEFVQHQLS